MPPQSSGIEANGADPASGGLTAPNAPTEARASLAATAAVGAGEAAGDEPPKGAIAIGTAAAGTHMQAPQATTGDTGSDASGNEDGALDAGTGTADDTVEPAAVPPTISIPANETIIPLGTPTPTRTPTATPTRTPTAAPGGSATIGGCPVFPADNSWNQNILTMPVDANSATYISNIGGGNLHADFGGGGAYGIPYIVVPQSQPMTAINFTDYGDESDPGPYPIPLNAPIEGGAGSSGDRHVLAVQQGTCMLYELFSAYPTANGWDAASGAVFDLRSNALRPETWTSADAAGLPITAGLVRYDEVAAGQINHAVRFTVNTVRKAWVHPATHYGTSTSATRIPYGAKLRLKASFDVSSFDGQSRVILNALKKFGMIVADQGTSWYITGDGDPRWDDDDLNQLKTVPGSAFEVVQLGQIYTYP